MLHLAARPVRPQIDADSSISSGPSPKEMLTRENNRGVLNSPPFFVEVTGARTPIPESGQLETHAGTELVENAIYSKTCVLTTSPTLHYTKNQIVVESKSTKPFRSELRSGCTQRRVVANNRLTAQGRSPDQLTVHRQGHGAVRKSGGADTGKLAAERGHEPAVAWSHQPAYAPLTP